jgi:RNA polymerase sigma factor (sigma-70 family)
MRQSSELIPTRMTLIERLKKSDDQESWREFFEIYWRLIYSVAIRFGLTTDEAQEVVQETVISVSKNIGKFKADPAFGSFKGWLLQLTRWRIASQVRKRPKEETMRFHMSKTFHRDEASTATEERIADPAGNKLDAIWDDEWKKNLLETALEKLKRRVSAKHYQIFHTHVIEDMPVTKVAKMLGTNVAMVYVVKHRLRPMLKKALIEVESSRT